MYQTFTEWGSISIQVYDYDYIFSLFLYSYLCVALQLFPPKLNTIS